MAKRHNFIKIGLFCKKYGIVENNIFVMKSQGRIRDYAFNGDDYDTIMINENYFTRRDSFRKKIDNLAHDYYYYLSKYFSDTQIATLLITIDNSMSIDSWRTFLNSTLFARRDATIISCRISLVKWKFFKLTRKIIRNAFLMTGRTMYDKDLAIVWDLKEKRLK